MGPLLGTKKVRQVALIVKDVEASKKVYAEFFGMPVPPTVEGGKYEITQVTYKGQPAPKAGCKMAFFDLDDGLQLEMIEPNGEPSTWQEFLDNHGEGIHHIAFSIQGTDKVLENCANAGIECVQRGKYGNGGGEYAYLNTEEKMHCSIELLEKY